MGAGAAAAAGGNRSVGFDSLAVFLDHRPFLDLQVLVQHRRSQRLGVEVQGQRSLLVKAGEQELAAARHFLGGGGAKHLVDISGSGAGDQFYFGLRHGHKKQHMPAQQLHRAIDDLGAHGGFGQVGHPKNE